MSVYSYPQSRIIDEVAFITSDKGGCRGYLHANDLAGKDDLRKVVAGLVSQGYDVIPCSLNNVPALEVRGFKKPNDLLNYMHEREWLSGARKVQQDPRKKKSFLDHLRDRSLQASGAFFILADAGFVKYGFEEKRWEDVVAGFAYMGGSATMMLFGHTDRSNVEIRQQAKKLLQYAKEYDLRISPDDAIAAIANPPEAHGGKKVLEIFKQYPAEIGNTITAIAGAMIAFSAAKSRVFKKFDPEQVGQEAIKNNEIAGKILRPEDRKLTPREFGAKTIRKKRIAGKMDIGLGSTTFASGMIGAWVKEKVKDPDAPPSHGMQSIMDWVQEKPLRVAGLGYMISTLCHAGSTYVEYKDAKITRDKKSLKAVPWRILFIVSTIIGEVLLTVSSKGHGEGVKADTSTDDSILALTANLVAKQPESMQEALIEQLSKFLGRPDVLALKDTEAAQKLREQVEKIKNNPWLGEAPKAAALSSQPRETGAPSAAWQAKIAGQEKGAGQPQVSI